MSLWARDCVERVAWRHTPNSSEVVKRGRHATRCPLNRFPEKNVVEHSYGIYKRRYEKKNSMTQISDRRLDSELDASLAGRSSSDRLV